MEDAALEDAQPIFELAIECERLWEEQIAGLKEDNRTYEATILSELNQRFAAWAAFLGVFAESKVCLDRRLRRHVEIQEQVLRLMAIMKRNLPFVFKADNFFEPMDVEHAKERQHLTVNVENLEAIFEAIERLNYIGIAIRQSSVTSHTAKAREFAETFDFTSFEGFAYLALKTMYFAASEELLELLTQSMTKTYALFLHRKARHGQLQAPRSRTQTPIPLHTIPEDLAADTDLDPQTSEQGRNSAAALLRNPPPSRQLSKPELSSEPTSLDSHEAKARIRKTLSSSVKGATTSILVSQADYSRPAEGSMTCDWCFSPLPINQFDRDEWQKHVNEDHRPYLCISEKCPDSSPRFATSGKWLAHMLITHGQNWHREAFPTSSWICPLCNDDDTVFPIPDELASHLADSHGKVFARPEIQAIVQQSRIRSPRPRNECPLCCLSIEDQQDSPSKEKRKGKAEEPTSMKSRDNTNVDRSRKHTNTEAVYTELDQHIRDDGHQARTEQQLQEPKTKAKPSPTKIPTAKSIGSHIAGHLQAVMALTLRMISIDVAIGVSADNQSVHGDTDNHSSRVGSIQRSLDQESDTLEDILIPEDGDITFDGLQPEAIPDSEEYFNWKNMRPDGEDSIEDEFLQGVIKSGAFQSHLDEGAPKPSTVPFGRDPDFVDRCDLLMRIGERCSQPAGRAALVGLGGVGKSQLAIEYTYRTRERSPDIWVFWVHASNAARFEQGYRDIADVVKIAGREDPKADIFKLVHDWLRGCEGKWLMILDNVDDADFLVNAQAVSHSQASDSGRQILRPLQDYLPQSQNGSILITTRSRESALKLSKRNDLISVNPMDTSNAVEVLDKKLESIGQRNDKDLIELAAALEFMPLAIVQAASYISRRSPRYSVRQYIEDFRKSDRKKTSLLNYEGGQLRRDLQAQNSIITTWQISFEYIQRQRPSASDLLSLMSFFDRQGIPEVLVRKRPEIGNGHRSQEERDKHDDREEEEGDNDDVSEYSEDDGFEDDVQILKNYSFLSVGIDGTFEMYALVQLATRKWLEANGKLEQWKQRYIKNLSAEFPNGEYENWTYCRTLFPHAKSAVTQRPKAEGSLREWASLLYNTAWYTWRKGSISEAVGLSEMAMKVRKKILGQEHEETLSSMGMVGLAYNSAGRWKEAEKLEVQVMETRKRVLGEEHPDTLRSIASLASTYRNQGRWKEAEELEVQVIETTKRVLGKEHPDTLRSIANLASTYRNQGRWKEAEELEIQVIETTKRVLGEVHPDMLSSMANLASTYGNQGRWKEAEELEVQVIETRKRVLGKEHPDTLRSIANLASIYRNQGRWKEAEELEVQIIETTKRVLGEVHPDMLSSMANLASIYGNQGRWKEAEELEVQVIETRKRVLGEEHPDTLTSMNNFTFTLKDKGEDKMAIALMEECVEKRKQVLGQDHPFTKESEDTLSMWRMEGLHLASLGKDVNSTAAGE